MGVIPAGTNLFAPALEDPVMWLIRVLGRRRLSRRVRRLREELRSSPLSVRGVFERHHVELMLGAQLDSGPSLLVDPTLLELALDARTFAACAHRLDSFLSPEGHDRHAGALRQGLDADYGFAAIRAEYVAANMALDLGADVEPVDLEGIGQFDFLLRRDGEEVELECKLLSHDYGNAISSSRFERLGRALEARLGDGLLVPATSRVLWLDLLDDLPKSNEGLDAFVDELVRFVRGEASELPAPIRRARFEDWAPGLENPVRAFAEARFITEVCPRHTLEFHSKNSALILALRVVGVDPQAAKRELLRSFRKAASQCTGSRPAALFVEVEGPSPARPGRELLRKVFESVLKDFFAARPFLELVILGFPGPPFTAGATYALRNKRRKRRNQSYLIRGLERAATRIVRPSGGRIAGFEFRDKWWKEKYRWDFKSQEELVDAVRRRRQDDGGEGSSDQC